MKNRRALIYSVLIAVLALMFQCSYIRQNERLLQDKYEPIQVLVAKVDIPKDFKLDDTMVEYETVPKEYVQPRALKNVDEILGQISGSTIFKGEQILQTKLLSIEDAGLAFKIPKNFRAFTVAVDDIKGVGGHIRPGNYVDVMGIFDFGDNIKMDQRAVTLLQNVYVLACGLDLGQTVVPSVSEDDKNPKPAVVVPSGGPHYTGYRDVTLMLTPDEAQKIMLAQEIGSLNLTLRSLWEGNTQINLERMSVREAIGIPEKIYRRARAEYREIRAGEY